MALLKIKCPECSAALKSGTGFAPGKTVCCPKCETYFTVPEPEDEGETEDEPSPAKAPGKKPAKAAAAVEDDEDEKPKKKKKKKPAADEDDEARSYKNSPVRYAVLGVLLIVLIVLGVMLYLKKKNEAAAEGERKDTDVADKKRDDERPNPRPNPNPNPRPNPNPNPNPIPIPPPPKKGPVVPPPGKGGGLLDGASLGGLFDSGPVPADVAKTLTQKYTAALVGSWSADLGAGVTEQLVYNANGTFTAARTGGAPASAGGKYTVKGLVGTKGLKLQLDGAAPRTITVTFDDDELQHPSLQPNVTAVFRKRK